MMGRYAECGGEPTMPKRPDYIVNTVVELEGGQSRWREVGVAFKNDKDTVTILLDAVPLTGRLVLTRPKERQQPQGQ